MSARDRSWTVGPTFLWFMACMIVGVVALDGGVQALADRFTAPRGESPPPAAGPTFEAKPVTVADATDDERPTAAPLAAVIDRSHILALEDTCVDGRGVPPVGGEGPRGSSDGAAPTCKRWAMDGFYRAVERSKQGKLGRAVRVSWYGDSVIATDAIPGRLRSLLQAELGDGGPGYVYAVPPHRFCGHEAIARWSAGTWLAHAISTTLVPDGLYGVGGSTAETEDGRATIKLNAGAVSQIELYYLAQPRGGTAKLLADGKEVASIDTRSATKQAGYAAVTVDGGAKKLELAAAGKLRVFGLGLENPTGAVVDNLGVVSVNAKSFEVNNVEHFQGEVAHRNADLVMVMIGANEAQWLGASDKATKEYATHYAKLLTAVRKARPDAACLVVSPTDQAEAKDGEYPSRPVMPLLVRAQRDAAIAQGCAFYSTYDWMGGKGSAAKWFRKGYVGSDFQHLSRKGANRLSEALHNTLMAGYQKYAAH